MTSTETFTSMNGQARQATEKTAEAFKQGVHQANEQADKVERVQREKIEQAERAEKEQAREAKRVERERAKKADDEAKARYEGLTKSVLTDPLAERGLQQ